MTVEEYMKEVEALYSKEDLDVIRRMAYNAFKLNTKERKEE